MRAWQFIGLPLAVVACGRGEAPRTGQTTLTQAGEVVGGPITTTELAAFAPLPAVMASPDFERTPAQVALGRTLYYETRLSEGHNLSCNSCHALNAYGSDGRKVSPGTEGKPGGRNSPTVYHAAGHVAQFWDGRAATVEEQAKGPVLNPVEMGMPDSSAVLAHLRGDAEYRAAFRAAFPGQREPVTYDNMARAIGAFERGLVTPARWDAFLAGDRGALTDAEQRGAGAFVRAGCGSCHSGAYLGGMTYMKLGLVKPWPNAADSGRVKVTGNPADLFVFKVPSLRNIEMTGPYFHDGSVESLDDAIRLMARHQLGNELADATVREIRTWIGTLTGELPLDYIAQPPRK